MGNGRTLATRTSALASFALMEFASSSAATAVCCLAQVVTSAPSRAQAPWLKPCLAQPKLVRAWTPSGDERLLSGAGKFQAIRLSRMYTSAGDSKARSLLLIRAHELPRPGGGSSDAAHLRIGTTRTETSFNAVASSTQRNSLCSGRPNSSMTGKVIALVCVRAR